MSGNPRPVLTFLIFYAIPAFYDYVNRRRPLIEPSRRVVHNSDVFISLNWVSFTPGETPLWNELLLFAGWKSGLKLCNKAVSLRFSYGENIWTIRRPKIILCIDASVESLYPEQVTMQSSWTILWMPTILYYWCITITHCCNCLSYFNLWGWLS